MFLLCTCKFNLDIVHFLLDQGYVTRSNAIGLGKGYYIFLMHCRVDAQSLLIDYDSTSHLSFHNETIIFAP